MKIFSPKVNDLMSFPNHVLIWIKSGKGLIEVDFKTYTNFENKLIYLSPDQPIKFVFGEFEVAKIDFPIECVSQSRESRVLFKHLISLGYIEFSDNNKRLIDSLFSSDLKKILDISTQQWFWQNPFEARKEEYALIFDLKEVIDNRFRENISVPQLTSNVDRESHYLQKLVKTRLGLTIKKLIQNKLLLESKKEIALTNKPIQEIADGMGFKDPAYFNRFFKQKTLLTPRDFRTNFGENSTDVFIQDLLELIQLNHKAQHSTSFYAAKTYMSIKTLARKVKTRLNLTVGDLIRNEIIKSAEVLLSALPVKEVAYELGFEEANHFSAFFKKYTGIPPTKFQSKKYNF